MTRSLFALACSLACSLAAAAASGAVIQVPDDHARVADALAAATPGDTVRLAAGTYSPSSNGEAFPLDVPDGVVLEGAGAGASILDAERSATVLRLAGTGTSVVRGLTLTGGSGDWGGGIDVQAGAHEIAHNLVVDNAALRRGSGINVTGDAAPWIHHNVVWANFDLDLVHSGDPHGIQCADTSTGLIEHNLIGRTDSNGLIVQNSSAPVIRHNIFYRNGIDGRRGRGICNLGSPAASIHHNLFHGNSISALLGRDATGTLFDLSGAAASALLPDDGIADNLDGDPLFVDEAGLDFRLLAASPAIDAGDPALPGDPDGSAADLGPFPFDPGAVDAPAASRSAVRVAAIVPNPFNPSTVIELELAAPGPVEATLFDLRGRRVRDLAREDLPAGRSVLRWDGRGDRGELLGSGVYLLRVRARSGEARGRLVLLR